MATIDDKIKQFKKEIGEAVLTGQQQRVYDTFVRTSGKPVLFTVTDKNGNTVKFQIFPDRPQEGSQHILLKHFHGRTGNVSAFDILSICDTVQFGDIVINDKNHICYKWKRTSGGKTVITSLKIIKSGYILKSFYSEVEKKISCPRLSFSPQSSARGGKSPRLGASDKKSAAKVTKKSKPKSKTKK